MMSDDTAAWIREHVWTAGMRKLFAAVPSFYLDCACQSGTAYRCQEGQHGRCARGGPLRQRETSIMRRGGTHPAMGLSEVWLADRECVWRCKCGCHADAPTRPTAPMSAEAAAWVREHVWTKTMRNTHKTTPNAASKCACQYGPSGHCNAGKHGKCWHTGNEPYLDPETYVCGAGGDKVLYFPDTFAHPTGSATGPKRSSAAMVWLADRACRWRCPCDCHTSSGTASEPVLAATEPPVDKPVQLDLFASLTA